jgi:hypothetical protein
VQTIFPVLERAIFDPWLTARLERPTATISGCALLNAVIASGYRAALSDETTSGFQNSSRESWGYFQNALWYESKLVNGHTDLLAVQALAVMTVYAQGMSSPQRLEYTLSSTTSRLAQSLSLHRHAPPEWGLSEDELEERSRVFWVVYCLDKTIALRCGRPSAILDDDISCPFPRSHITPLQDTSDNRTPPSFFLLYARFSRICGRISSLLYSATALCQPSSHLANLARRVLANIESWKMALPTRLRPGQHFGRIQTVGDYSRLQLLVLHFSYYDSICAVHRRFTAIFVDNEINNQAAANRTPTTCTHKSPATYKLSPQHSLRIYVQRFSNFIMIMMMRLLYAKLAMTCCRVPIIGSNL